MKKTASCNSTHRVITTMGVIALLFATSFAQALVAAEEIAYHPDELRQKTLLNFDWQFRKGGKVADALSDGTKGGGWQTVQLPHDASIGGKFSRKNSDGANGWLPRGSGVYRKSFTLPEAARGKRVLVEFQGVYRDAHVWLNGHEIGKQLNGYTGFEVDLTANAVFGGTNNLIVTYDNRTPATSRWYTGEGIYRDVWLRILDPIHVPLNGTYVVTPNITPKDALVAIQTEVRNDAKGSPTCRLVTEIRDAKGCVVVEAPAVAPIRAGDTYTFRQEMHVPDPVLWELDRPHLYTAVSKVYRDEKLLDVYESRFGIREILMTPERGLTLNGKKVVAVGGDLHHDLGCLGSAALKAGYDERIDELKAIGCNSVRLSHNPHAPVLLDVCDEKGILVYDEIYDKWTSQYYGGKQSFESQWRNELAEFIRRDRNHPSVYIWSMGNEVLDQQLKYDKKFQTSSSVADYGAGLMRRMAEQARILDPSRKVTAALFPAREKFICEFPAKDKYLSDFGHWTNYPAFMKSRPAEMAFEMDVVSWNYTENMFALDHKSYPQLMFIASETSSNLKFGKRRPSWLEMDTNYVIGHYYWSGYDYLGESPWPQKSWGRSLIDLAGWVTPLGRYYQSFYSKQPMVHIMVMESDKGILDRFEAIMNKRWDWYPMVDHWNWPGRQGAKVTTFTNCEEVELLLNGKSLGVKKLADGTDGRIDWDIPCEPGELKAQALTGGKVVTQHTLQTAKAPARIQLNPKKQSAAADGLDLVFVDVDIVDSEGRIVPVSGTRIRFDVSGAGVNAGVENGNIISDESWQAETRKTWNGHCRLVVRAGRTPGNITVTASTEGLPPATLVIPCR